jgi:REP element-mobilizing transposase RayT
MARPLRIQYPGAFYHVTCRGNERKEIFLDSRDRTVSLEKLAASLEIYTVALLAYVCMPNHIHLLITTPHGNLSEFMRHFNLTYTSAFNRRHNRVGHLYQGRFKAFLVDADNYLLEVSRYIHLNPVRTRGNAKRPATERWDALLRFTDSSLPGYLSVRSRKDFIPYEVLLRYMGGDDRRGRERYRRFVRQGVEGDIPNPLELGKGNGIVGGQGFVGWVKEQFLIEAKPEREQPALRNLAVAFEPEALLAAFIRLTGMGKDELCRRGKNSIERAMLMEFLHRFCRMSQPEIGRLVGGIDYSAVSQARKRLRERLEMHSALRKKYKMLEAGLLDLSRIKI